MAALPAVPSYSQEILSLHELDKRFPIRYSNLDFNRGIAAGAPIQHDNLEHAEAIATAVKAHVGKVF
jgi:hypothetical protein